MFFSADADNFYSRSSLKIPSNRNANCTVSKNVPGIIKVANKGVVNIYVIVILSLSFLVYIYKRNLITG